jgi:hypothetical protein
LICSPNITIVMEAEKHSSRHWLPPWLNGRGYVARASLSRNYTSPSRLLLCIGLGAR